MKNRKIPKGLRDLLPAEVKVRRNMESKVMSIFAGYGYQEVITPTFEFLEVVESGAGGHIREDMFLFMDREGGILALRPEVTVSIARLAATHLQDRPVPQRLFYLANVFRHVQPQKARYREFWQMGIELLGATGALADAEVITIAAQVLRGVGLEQFKISLNHIAIYNSLLAESGLSGEEQEVIHTLVENKDLVELSRVLENLPLDDRLKESIAILPVLHGGLEVLKRVPYLEKNRTASSAVDEMLRVYETLALSGIKDDIVIDMGVLRGLDYYTGIVFEGYSPELGYGLLGGGRYDNLMQQFGLACPATGFALGLDRLAMILPQQQELPERFLIGGQDTRQVLARAQVMRSKNMVVEMDLDNCSREQLEARLAGQDNYTLVYVE